MNCTIITIGDELLIGQTIDTNSAWMSYKLNQLGINVIEILTTRDSHKSILSSLVHADKQSDLVLITGGLGPTEDDITKSSMAAFYGVPLEFSNNNWDIIKNYLKSRNRQIQENHKLQCYLPKGVTIIENNLGTAPGMWFEKDNTIFVNMPGVPYEMKTIMENGVLPKLKNLSKTKIIHHTIQTIGRAESHIEEQISPLLKHIDPRIKVAYLPSLAQVRVRLSAKVSSLDFELVKDMIQDLSIKISEVLGSIVFTHGEKTLPEVFLELCKSRAITIGTAESCTGGNIAHIITLVPESSKVFIGSVIAYANTVKERQLHVDKQTLLDFGAVSKQTVEQMLYGLIDVLQVDYGIAVSGIAGPGGGSLEKPVGTIWIAVGNKTTFTTKKILINKGRKQNIEYATMIALDELRKLILTSEL